MATARSARQRHERLALALLTLILLLAAALRLVALARAPLWWDEGNNAYFAHASLPDLLTMSRATLDTDPPAHRLALKAWLWLLGDGALQLRALSALCGVLSVWLLYAWGRWLYGRPAGLAAAALAAIWPALVYHGREGKPYTWVLLLAGLSAYLWQRHVDGAPRVRWGPWLGAVLAGALALGAHYYVALWIAAQGLGLLVTLLLTRAPWRETRRRLGRWLAVQVAAVALVTPWVALTWHAALTGAAGLPEVGVPASLRSYGASLLTGLTVASADAPQETPPLALVLGALLLVMAGIGLWRHRRQTATWQLLLLALVPLALGFVARLLVPFSHARFLLYTLAPLMILAGAGLAQSRRWALAPALALTVAASLAMPGALGPLRASEDDLRPIAAALAEHAQPGDGVVVGYVWQEGILRMRAPDLPVHYHLGWFDEGDLELTLVTLLRDHGRLWLLDYHQGRRDHEGTAAWWLETHTARILDVEAPPYDLALYSDPQPGSQWREPGVAMPASGPRARFEGGLTLVSASASRRAAPGGEVLLTLNWVLTGDDVPPWVVFVHLVDETGRLWAQSDGPPEAWLHSFADASPGEALQDERALLVPADAPPGPYRLLLGLYHRDSGQRSLVLSGAPEAGGDHLVLGLVTVGLPH